MNGKISFILLACGLVLNACNKTRNQSEATYPASETVITEYPDSSDLAAVIHNLVQSKFNHDGLASVDSIKTIVPGQYIVYGRTYKEEGTYMAPYKVDMEVKYKGNVLWDPECYDVLRTNVDSDDSRPKVEADIYKERVLIFGGIRFKVLERKPAALLLYSKQIVRGKKIVTRVNKDIVDKGWASYNISFTNNPNARRGQDYAAISGQVYTDFENNVVYNAATYKKW